MTNNNTQASQQVPSADRATFEQAINDKRFFPRELDFSRHASPSGRDEYVNSHLQSNWEGYQLAFELLAQSATAATEQLMIEKRISVTPEFEGGFVAAVYMEEAEPIANGYGNTPREAIDDALSKGIAHE